MPKENGAFYRKVSMIAIIGFIENYLYKWRSYGK